MADEADATQPSCDSRLLHGICGGLRTSALGRRISVPENRICVCVVLFRALLYFSDVRWIKAPPVEIFTGLPVGVNSNKPARGSVSLI